MSEKYIRILKILRIILIILAELAVGAAAGAWVGAWAIPSAYEFRGYNSVGGEWVLILVTAFTAMWGFYRLVFKKKRFGGEKENGEVQEMSSCIIH